MSCCFNKTQNNRFNPAQVQVLFIKLFFLESMPQRNLKKANVTIILKNTRKTKDYQQFIFLLSVFYVINVVDFKV